jgi:arylsulfatase A-like enzyme
VVLFVGPAGPDHWGTYRDRCVRTPHGWRIAERSMRFTGFAPGSSAPKVAAALTGSSPVDGSVS